MIRVIAGTAKNKRLQVPETGTRSLTDRVKTTVFDLIQDYVQDTEVLDLFAGSGAYGIEALSRGAKSATFIDYGEEAINCIKTNLNNCGFLEQGRVIKGKLPGALTKINEQGRGETKNDKATCDLIFCDPPFTQISTFDLKDYSQLITTTNLFILRVPKEYKLKTDILNTLKIEYEKIIGISRVIFLRKVR